MAAASHTCPICSNLSGLPPENTTFPFCSVRCKNVDLGKWLGEEYRITSEMTDRDLRFEPQQPTSVDDED